MIADDLIIGVQLHQVPVPGNATGMCIIQACTIHTENQYSEYCTVYRVLEYDVTDSTEVCDVFSCYSTSYSEYVIRVYDMEHF